MTPSAKIAREIVAKLPAKPKFREPCNGCGVCCALEVCQMGEQVFGLMVEAPCPAIETDGQRILCGLVMHPANYIAPHWPAEDRAKPMPEMSALYALAIGSGQGCGMEDEEEGTMRT